MKKLISLQITFAIIAVLFAFTAPVRAQEEQDKENEKAVPVFEEGEAQIVPAFEDSDKWIRHDLWVETESTTSGLKQNLILMAMANPTACMWPLPDRFKPIPKAFSFLWCTYPAPISPVLRPDHMNISGM
jgi:hypothetical protein